MPAAYDRCVKHVKKGGGAKNAYAVCRASMGSDAEIKAKHRSKTAAGGRKGRKRHGY